ncbi:MAG TPA: secondary thiamine-phosphate synthase enzyme YjbQ [Bacteroidales bacterium]|nr:secondary thiamine-phosphate synthase enzyme YjbQ [Bacteroidales bacterium]
MINQIIIKLPAYRRGFHLITDTIIAQLGNLPQTGVLHLFLKHTSAGLTINENADPSVRYDLERWFDKLVKERDPLFTHTMEGDDDMPAHIKTAIIGHSLSIPIVNGRPGLGTWQGIYLCEFRNHAGQRLVTATIIS